MTRIDMLTAAQRGRFSEWVERWVEQGLSTAPADRARVEAGIRACYRFAGLPEPEAVLWVPSPLAGVLEQPRPGLYPLPGWSPLSEELTLSGRAVNGPGQGLLAADSAAVHTGGSEVALTVDEELLSALQASVGDAVGAELWFEIWSAVDSYVGWMVDEQVSVAIEKMVGANHWQDRFGGSWWCAFQAWSSFLREICGLRLPAELAERADAFAAAQSAGWWWPHDRFAVVCDRPTWVSRDEHGHLHCATGPAISWSDGWALWFWHGQRHEGPEDLARTIEQERQQLREQRHNAHDHNAHDHNAHDDRAPEWIRSAAIAVAR
jgi:hypothetical protein